MKSQPENNVSAEDLQREKLALEIAELQFQQRQYGRLLHGWTPYILAALTIAGAWVSNRFGQERADLAAIKDAYDREQSYARAVKSIGASNGQIIVTADDGEIYHHVTFMPEVGQREIAGGNSGVELPNEPLTREAITALSVINPLYELDLSHTSVRDGDLKLLPVSNGIESVFLGGTKITDTGLSYLSRIKTIEILDLAGTKVSPSGLSYLVSLPNLRQLSIANTNVWDAAAALKHLKRLPSLEVLRVGRMDFGNYPSEDAEKEFLEEFKAHLPGVEILGIRPPS